MAKKQNFSSLFIGIAVVYLISTGIFFSFFNKKERIETIKPVVKTANGKILADGMIRSENEVNLHFAVGGKLVQLPFKEGDKVWKGQTIASLDTYSIQKQLQSALNNYRAIRNGFDQLKDNIQNNVEKAQLTYPYDYFSKAGIGEPDRQHAIDDTIKRIADESQAGLDNSVIQVELTNYAYTLASIQSPFNGIITHLDVTTPNVMITPATSFMIADPDALVFRANVSESDINFIQEGGKATIQLTGMEDKTFDGIITKIYPDKVTLPTGENVYQVDIESADLKSVGNYRQDGTVLISNKYNSQVILVPTWMILSKQYVWILENGKPVLKTITIGDSLGNMTEITKGLKSTDLLITNPSSIAGGHYIIL